jgi:serine/threonine-protein kinase
MGNVHEAWDVVLCRNVALKILKDIEPAALIRFMHEAQIHARVVHPNICRIYDVDNFEGTLRVAMQLVPGPNLEQARLELTLREGVAIMALVAQAVHVVHRLNLIHRDLKPSNILLERDAQGQWTPYVCDFGLAMALDEPALTYSRGVLGTPAYMAPEQFRGERSQISAATDVYALGGTLQFALTGHPPTGPTGSSGARSQDFRNEELAGVPRDLRTIITKCLEENPEHRYPTASALAEDLLRFLDGVPVEGGTRSAAHRLGDRGRQWLRLNRVALVVLGAALLTSGGWLAFTRRQDGIHRQQRLLARQFVMETEALAADFRLEQTLPIHDLGPSYARIRARLERDRNRMLASPHQGQAAGHFALGTADFLVCDFAAARNELAQAWVEGFQAPEAATRLAWAALASARAVEESAQFDPGAPVAAGPLAGQERAILLQAMDRDMESRGDDALLACLAKDYLRGATLGHAAFLGSPWHWEWAILESTCLASLARQEREEGHLAKARLRFSEAVAAARAALPAGQSDPNLYHAYFKAARGLAALDLEWGDPPQPFLPAELLDTCDRALRLDPGNPDLQDDWVAFRWLRARRLAQLGQDPEPDLKAAKAFLDTWAREPLTVGLRASRMLVNWHLAERSFLRGGDPGPALAEALKTAGHTPFLYRDYLWEVLNFKARVEAARGVDPRPALDAAMGTIQFQRQAPSWSLQETFACTWLIRAQWESAHGLDPGESVRNALALAETAQSRSPDSAYAWALVGLARVQELKVSPQDRLRLRRLAQECLRRAQFRSPQGASQALLKRALLALPN